MAIKSFLSEGGFSVGSVGSAPIEVIDSSGNITAVGLTVSGNLVVNGSTTTINSTTTTLDDPIFTLGGDTVPTSDDNKDRGIEFRWHDGSLAKVGFFGFDDSTGKFVFIPNATNTSEVFSGTKGTIDANLEWADVLSKPSPVITVTLTGDVTGTANTTLTSLGNGTVTISTTVAADSVALGTDTTGAYVQAINNGSYLTGGNGPSGSESAVLTLAVDATSANTASKVVARDASGNFSAGSITATGMTVKGASTLTQLILDTTTSGSKEIVFYDAGVLKGYVWNSGSVIGMGGGSGNNSLFVNTTTGNTGVGTNTPGGRLEVNFTAATGATALILRTSDSGGNGAIRWQNSGGTNQAGIGSNFNVSDVGALEFLNGTTTNVIFRSSGNVGIGTTAPDHKLDVVGAASTDTYIRAIGGSGGTKGGFIIGNNDVTKSYGKFYWDNVANTAILQHAYSTGYLGLGANSRTTDLVILASNGNVGIGTTSPGAKLHVAGPHADEGADRAATTALIVDTKTDGTGDGKTYIKTGWVNTGNYGVSTLGVGYYATGSQVRDVITMLGTGRVGVGTTTPTQRLHLNGGVLRISGGGSAGQGEINLDSGTEYDGWQVRKESSTMWGVKSVTSGNDLAIFVDNTTARGVYIKTGGNVGINQTNPQHKLDVGGAIRTTDWLYIENSNFGIYSNASTAYFSTSTNNWDISSGPGQTWSGLRLYSGGRGNTWRGHFYGDADGQGFLNSAGNWQLTVDSSSRLRVYAGVYNIEGTTVRVLNPGGAALNDPAAPVTGAFKIKLPVAAYNSNTMMTLVVDIYNYDTGKSLRFRIGGYNYQDGSWYNTFAEQTSDLGVAAYNVRFGNDGTSNCIWIGETNSTWQYPKVYVSEFLGGHGTATAAWASGWTITRVTAFDTVVATRNASVGVNNNNIGTYSITPSNYTSTLDTRYLRGDQTNPSTPGNFNFSVGTSGTYSFIQSHASTPLYLNPVGNNVIIASSSANNLGVGTTGPDHKITAEDSSANGTRIAVNNTGNAAAGAGIYMRTYNGASLVSNATLRTNNAGSFELFTGTSTGTLAITVNSSQNTTLAGNLTVQGTGTQTLNGKLDVITAASSAANVDIAVLRQNYAGTAGHEGLISFTNISGTSVGKIGTRAVDGNNTSLVLRNFVSGSLADALTLSPSVATLSGNLTVSGTGTSSFAGSVNVDGGINFLRGSGEYSTYIKANDYIDGGYNGSTLRYWIELGAKGGTHIVLNTDGSATSAENSYDHFTIWQAVNGTGAIAAGARKFWITNTGRVNLINGLWHKSGDGIERFYYDTSGTSFYKGGGSGSIHVFRNSSDVDILTLSNAKDAILSGNLAVNGGTGTIDATSGTASATLNLVGRSSGTAKTASIASNSAGSLLLSAEGAGSALGIAANTGNTTVAYNLTVNGTGKQTLGQSVNATVYAGNTSTTDQAIILSNTRRANYGDVMIAKNLEGVASADSYATPGTTAATGYAAVEMRYGGVVRVYGNSGATTATAVVAPNVLAEFTPTAIGLNLNTSVTGNLTVSGGQALISHSGSYANIYFAVTGSAYSEIRAFSSTGEFRTNSGPSAGWGGFLTWQTDASEKMRLTNSGNVLLKSDGVDSANGKVQLATHTTSAGGIGFGTDTALYRSQTGMLALDGLTGSLSQLDLRVGGVQKAFVAWNGGDFYLGAVVGTTVIKSSNTTALTLDSSQNATFTGSVSVAGNLTVNGTTTTVNSTVSTIKDPVITLGGGNAGTAAASDDNKDRGIEFKWHNGTSAKTGFFGYDDSSGYFTFIPDATNTSEVFSGTKGTIDANLVGNVTGSLSNALTAGSYLTGSPTSSYNGSVATTFNVDATSANIAGKVVARDASGNFSAGTITASSFTDGYNTFTLAQINRSAGAVELQYNKSAAGENVHIFGNTANRWAWQADTGKLVLGSAGDTNLYRSAADTLKTDDNFITAGNIGIGTTPSYKLDVAGAGSDNVGVRLTPDHGKVRFNGYDLLGYPGSNIWAISNGSYNQFTLGTSWNWDTSCDFTYTPGTAGAVGGSLIIGQTNKNSATFTHGYTALYTNGAEKVRLTKYGTLLVGDNIDFTSSAWWNNGNAVLGKNGTDKVVIGYLGSNTLGAMIGAHNSAMTAWAGMNINGSSISFRILEATKAVIDANGAFIQGGGTGRSTYGTTVVLNRAATFAANSDIGDGERFLSIVNDNSTTNAMATLGFRINPNGGNANAMLDMKFVNTGATSTSKLHYSFNHGGSWADRLTIQSDGNIGIGTTTPTAAKLQISSGGISTQDSTRTFAGTTFNSAIGSSDTRTLAFNGTGGSSVWWCDSGTPSFAIDSAGGTTGFWRYSSGWVQRMALDANGFGVNTTSPGVKLTTRSGTNSLPATSGTAQNGAGLRVEGGDNAVIDIGANSVDTWIQATDKSGLENYYRLLLNPRGGNVGIGVTTNPAYKLEVNGTFKTNNLTLLGGEIYVSANNTNTLNSGFTANTTADIWINYRGYNDGFTQFRNLNIGDGKGANVAWFDGTNRRLSINSGQAASYSLDINGDLRSVNGAYFATSSGNVGIGTTSPGYKLEVNGSFAATTKSFVIPHPTKEGKKLRYGSLEGPENGVYVRGKLKGSNVIELPDYWTKLVDPESITVQLTPIGSHQKLYVEKIEDNRVYVANENLLAKAINCFFYVLAERCDVEKLEVEIDA